MKIRIITIHSIPNFGSVFQSYALCKFLIDNGYTDTKIIDYDPPYYKKRTLRSVAGKLLNFRKCCRRDKKFRDFVKANIPLTEKRYTSIKELYGENFDADVYIAGGDQLWNVFHDCGNDDAYKLTFASGFKMSYATSMGQTDFTSEQLSDLCKKLEDFSAVSVRESSTVKLLTENGIDAVHCCDPVYLLDADDYDKFLRPVKKEKYMLVYLVTPSKLLEDCISFLKDKYSLKVILCSGLSKKCTCDEFLKDLGPDEILSYINGAEIVLSSSFHATSFSMILKKQFFTILPNEHTNERIIDVLKRNGLSDRIVTDETNLQESLCRVIDYSKTAVEKQAAEYSKDYLLSTLKKAEENFAK